MRGVEATLIVAWLAQRLSGLPGKTATALMVSRALTGWLGIERRVQGGSVEIGTNVAERAIRPVALGLETWLFEGPDQGGECSAGILLPIETASVAKPSSAMPSPASKIGQSSDQPRIEGLAAGGGGRTLDLRAHISAAARLDHTMGVRRRRIGFLDRHAPGRMARVEIVLLCTGPKFFDPGNGHAAGRAKNVEAGGSCTSASKPTRERA